MSTISSVSSRSKFNTSFAPTSSTTSATSSATKPSQVTTTAEKGTAPRAQGMQFKDTFDTGSTSTSTSGTDESSDTGPGSKAFGDKLHHAMEAAGVDDETIKTVLAGLNGSGQASSTQEDESGLDTLMSQLDGDSSTRLQGDSASLEQLTNNPELTSQLAQTPNLLKLLMNQDS